MTDEELVARVEGLHRAFDAFRLDVLERLASSDLNLKTTERKLDDKISAIKEARGVDYADEIARLTRRIESAYQNGLKQQKRITVFARMFDVEADKWARVLHCLKREEKRVAREEKLVSRKKEKLVANGIRSALATAVGDLPKRKRKNWKALIAEAVVAEKEEAQP